jgi:hypothetical protein
MLVPRLVSRSPAICVVKSQDWLAHGTKSSKVKLVHILVINCLLCVVGPRFKLVSVVVYPNSCAHLTGLQFVHPILDSYA